MGAKRSGATSSNLRNKNQAMAQYMKKHGIQRHVCRCPVCHGLVSLNALFGHLGGCKGR